MSRLIPTALLLLLITFSAVGQITGEHPVSTPVYEPSSAVSASAIASDGDGFLAVWLDGRASDGLPPNDWRFAPTISLYASRITAGGTVLDPSGILLAKTAAGSIAVAWEGDRYLIAWNSATGVMTLQLGADGRILAPERVAIRGAQLDGRNPMASNGKVTVLLVSFGVSKPGYVVLDRDENIVSTDIFPNTAVSLTGSGEFILTAGGGTIRLDSSGRFATRTTRGWPGVIACRSDGCATGFARSTHLAVAPYDPAALIPGEAADLAIDQSFQYSMGLAATGGGYVFVTGTLQRLNAAGQPIGSPVALPGSPVSSGVASNGRDVAVLRSSAGSLIVSIVTSAGVTPPAAVSISANAQHEVAMARGTTNYLAVWTEKNGTYAGRLSLDGLPLDGRGLLLGSNTGRPSVIFDGTSYFVVLRNPFSILDFIDGYTEPSSIVRVDPATGAAISVVSIAAEDLIVASNGFTRVAAWSENRNSRLVAAFLSPSGTIASAPVLVASLPPGKGIGRPSLAWNGTMWFLAWEDEALPTSFLGGYNPFPVALAVRGARLSTDLIPLDTQPIRIDTLPVLNTISSRVASDGHDFLVAWTADVLPDGKPSVRVRRVLATGALADSETVVSRGTVRDLVWDGARYDLAYSGGDPLDLALARLHPSGQPFETLAISATAGDDRSASLIPLGNGSILAAYTRVAFEPLYGGVERAFVGTLHALRERPSKPH